MKKWLALFLAAVLLFSATACGKKGEGEKESKEKNNQSDPVSEAEKPTESTDPLYDQAMAYIEAGDLEAAYRLLMDVEDTPENNKLITLRKKLVWVPVEVTHPHDGKQETTTFTYNDEGQPLSILNNLFYMYSASWVTMQAEYDEDSALIRYTKEDGSVITEEYTYTISVSKPLTFKCTEPNGDWESEVCTYDKNNNLLTKETTRSDGSWEKLVCDLRFDTDPRCITFTHTYSNGNKNTFISFYDKSGRELSSETIRSNGSSEKYEATYDENGNLKTVHGIDGDKWETTTYTYDENGNCLMIEEARDGYTEKTTYSYDENGNCLREWYESSSGWKVEHLYTYDENGNRATTERNYPTEPDNWIKATHAYDEENNCIRMEWSTKDKTGILVYDIYHNPLYSRIDGSEEYISAQWKLVYYPHGTTPLMQNACRTMRGTFYEFYPFKD